MTVYYNIDDITFARREILNNTLIRAIICMTDILPIYYILWTGVRVYDDKNII